MPDSTPPDAHHIDEMQVKLGQRVLHLREARGWSQDTFAHMTGMGRAYPYKIEQAKVDVRYSTLIRMAHVFGITVDELLKFD